MVIGMNHWHMKLETETMYKLMTYAASYFIKDKSNDSSVCYTVNRLQYDQGGIQVNTKSSLVKPYSLSHNEFM